MNLIIPTIKAVILFLWCTLTVAVAHAFAIAHFLLISMRDLSPSIDVRFVCNSLCVYLYLRHHSFRICRMFMYNLFNNVQSILNKMVLFAAIIIIGTLWRRQWHDLHTPLTLVQFSSAAAMLQNTFCVLCKSFTMINGIVFHTYDSLL